MIDPACSIAFRTTINVVVVLNTKHKRMVQPFKIFGIASLDLVLGDDFALVLDDSVILIDGQSNKNASPVNPGLSDNEARSLFSSRILFHGYARKA